MIRIETYEEKVPLRSCVPGDIVRMDGNQFLILYKTDNDIEFDRINVVQLGRASGNQFVIRNFSGASVCVQEGFLRVDE